MHKFNAKNFLYRRRRLCTCFIRPKDVTWTSAFLSLMFYQLFFTNHVPRVYVMKIRKKKQKKIMLSLVFGSNILFLTSTRSRVGVLTPLMSSIILRHYNIQPVCGRVKKINETFSCASLIKSTFFFLFSYGKTKAFSIDYRSPR